MSVHYSLCDYSFASKPTDLSYINNYLVTAIKPLDEFIRDVEQGKSYCGTIFNDNKRNSGEFLCQQVFGADFDETITLEEATKLLEDYGLNFTFGYYTFSHTEAAPRFRLLFVLDGLVESGDLAKDINNLLYRFFNNKSDKQTRDIARIWHGTNKEIFAGNLRPIQLVEFIEKLNFKIFASYEKYNRYTVDAGEITQESCLKNGQSYIIYNKNVHILDKNATSSKEIKAPAIRHWEAEDLNERCQVFREFVEGTKLKHDALMGLARNLIYINGGQKLFNDIIKSHPHYDKDKLKIIGWCKKNGVPPQWVRDFSPYPSDNNIHGSLVDLLKNRGRVVVLREPELMELEQAEAKMQATFHQIFTHFDTKVHVVKAAPGLGKSQIVKNIQGVLLGFPDHNLKAEQFQSSPLQVGTQKLCTPDIKGIFSKVVEKYLNSLYDKDLGRQSAMEIKSLSQGQSILSGQAPSDGDAARAYLSQLEATKQDGGVTVFTTHARAIKEDWLHSRIILDESPFTTLFEMHEAKISELEMVAYRLKVPQLQALLEDGQSLIAKPTPRFAIDFEALYDLAVEQRFTSHVLRFFHSQYYFIEKNDKVRKVYYVTDNRDYLSPFKQYVICDATACKKAYEEAFGDRLVFHDISNVKNIGTIIQHTGRSCSMTGLERYLNKITLDVTHPTITFKCLKEKVANASQALHFGASRGSNVHAGQNLNVLGTYHQNPIYYRLLSACLNLNVNEFEMNYREVEFEGRRFDFMTYSDPTLQRIQLEMVEGELVQAVHRARLLRHDCSVHLYSNFPLQQAQFNY